MIKYVSGAELDPARWWLTDGIGQLLDLSAGYDFSLWLVKDGTVVLAKTTGLAGGIGAGIEPTGDPSLTATWAQGELDLPAGEYVVQIQAHHTASDRDYRFVDVMKIVRWVEA